MLVADASTRAVLVRRLAVDSNTAKEQEQDDDASQSVLDFLALSLPPNELPAEDDAVVADLLVEMVSTVSSSFAAFLMELMIAVVSCLVVISEIVRLEPPCSPFLSRSFLMRSRSS